MVYFGTAFPLHRVAWPISSLMRNGSEYTSSVRLRVTWILVEEES